VLAVTRASTSSTRLPVGIEGELQRRQSGPYHLWWDGRVLLLRNLRPFWLFWRRAGTGRLQACRAAVR